MKEDSQNSHVIYVSEGGSVVDSHRPGVKRKRNEVTGEGTNYKHGKPRGRDRER